MAEGDISPWMPEQDRVRLALLGKLTEEAGELAARAARCIIHGLDERDPDSGRLNRVELERELADVRAVAEALRSVLDVVPDDTRAQRKRNGFYDWLALIRRAQRG